LSDPTLDVADKLLSVEVVYNKCFALNFEFITLCVFAVYFISARRKSVLVQIRAWPDVRVSGEFHPQVETFTTKVHDEQCAREFHYTTGN